MLFEKTWLFNCFGPNVACKSFVDTSVSCKFIYGKRASNSANAVGNEVFRSCSKILKIPALFVTKIERKTIIGKPYQSILLSCLALNRLVQTKNDFQAYCKYWPRKYSLYPLKSPKTKLFLLLTRPKKISAPEKLYERS